MAKFFVGLILGIIIAGGLAYYLTANQSAIINKVGSNQPNVMGNTNASSPIILAPGTKFKEASKAVSTAASNGSRAESNYDFYSILQGESDKNDKSDNANQENNTDNANNANNVKSAEFYVQVGGAFNDVDVANNMKAELALQGVEAEIKQQHSGSKVQSRVFVGPLSSMAEAQEISSKLNAKSIATQIITVN
jgi:cell division protein FtsN